MIRPLGKFFGDRSGAVAIEYGLIISLVVIAMVGGLIALADSTTDMWSNVSEQVEAAR